MEPLNAVLGTAFLVVAWVVPIAIFIVASTWVYHSVNRANATLEGIRDELVLGGAPGRSTDTL